MLLTLLMDCGLAALPECGVMPIAPDAERRPPGSIRAA